ncbi:MAG: hypothetical protein JWM20_431 [Patescibacteria group bacterium]|nr:hypothetical protein [Patescibacteria group bacterium]
MDKPWYKRGPYFIRDTWLHFWAVRPTRMASSLSYYALFSLVPVLVITFWLGSSVVDSTSLQKEIISQVAHIMGVNNSNFIQTVFVSAQNIGEQWWKAILAVIFLLVLAATGMGELKQSLDDMWETPYNSRPGIMATVTKYVISFAATFGFAVIFIFFIVGTRFFNAGITLGIPEATRNFLTTFGAPVVLFIISTFITFLAYAFLPERHIPKKHLVAGAAITGAFLTVGNIALGFYLAQSSTVATYGIAGSLVAILLWFYYSSLIFLFGASATWVYYDERRERLLDEQFRTEKE